MAFWDSLVKTIAVGATAGVAIGATAKGINSMLNSKQKRKAAEQEMELRSRRQDQSERKELLDHDVKLRELEFKQRQMEASSYVDLAKTQVNAQADIQTTSIKGQSDVAKANAMYGGNSPLNSNGMFYDRENGIMVDNRNVSVNTSMGMGLMGINYQQASNDNMNINQVQQKLLDAQNLLKQGLISEDDFNKIKSDLLKEAF